VIEHSSKNAKFYWLVGHFFYWWFVVPAILLALVGLIVLSLGLVYDVRPNKIVGAFALAGALFMWLCARVHLYFYPRLVAFIERMERRRAEKKASSVF